MSITATSPKGPCWVALDTALQALEERGSLRMLGSRAEVLDELHNAVLRCSESLDSRAVKVWRLLYNADWPLAARGNEWHRVELARTLVGVAESGTEEHVLGLLRSIGASGGEPAKRIDSVGASLASAIVHQLELTS